MIADSHKHKFLAQVNSSLNKHDDLEFWSMNPFIIVQRECLVKATFPVYVKLLSLIQCIYQSAYITTPIRYDNFVQYLVLHELSVERMNMKCVQRQLLFRISPVTFDCVEAIMFLHLGLSLDAPCRSHLLGPEPFKWEDGTYPLLTFGGKPNLKTVTQMHTVRRTRRFSGLDLPSIIGKSGSGHLVAVCTISSLMTLTAGYVGTFPYRVAITTPT